MFFRDNSDLSRCTPLRLFPGRWKPFWREQSEHLLTNSSSRRLRLFLLTTLEYSTLKAHFESILSIFDIGFPLFPRRLAGLSGNRHFVTSSSRYIAPTNPCFHIANNVYSVGQVALQKNGISANTQISSGLSSDGLMR